MKDPRMVLRRCFPSNSLAMLGDENSTTTFWRLPLQEVGSRSPEDISRPYAPFRSSMYGSSKRGSACSLNRMRRCLPSGNGGINSEHGGNYCRRLDLDWVYHISQVRIRAQTLCIRSNARTFASQPWLNFGRIVAKSELSIPPGHWIELYALSASHSTRSLRMSAK